MSMTLLPRRHSTTVTAMVFTIPVAIALGFIVFLPTHIEKVSPGLITALMDWLHTRHGVYWLTLPRIEKLANVLLFIPVGVLAYLIYPRRLWALAVVTGPVLSVGIELTQLFLLPGRTASLWDVAANSIGATIGVAVAALCTFIVSLTPGYTGVGDDAATSLLTR